MPPPRRPRASSPTAAGLLITAVALLTGCGSGTGVRSDALTVTVTAPARSAAAGPGPAFAPAGDPLGAGIDGHGQGETHQIYTPHNIRAMLSTGLGPLAYRLRTELGQEAWHWNPVGSFSDPACRCGYWVSSSRPGRRYSVSYGYRLPRRGDTIDQANNDGYSRLDDGRPGTFWKSNPYLDPHFTHEAHPQWVMVDLGRVRPIDAARLAWSEPYARRFTVERWVGRTPPARYGAEGENAVFAGGPAVGAWVAFPRGGVTGGRGGSRPLRLADRPIGARYLRVFMTAGSGSAPAGSRDVRDRLGFALAEVGFGRMKPHGRLEDYVRHAASNGAQSVIWVSSTDPWHRATDIDRSTEQPSFDTVFASGLARRSPVLMPIAMAYGVPADAAAELVWLRRRGYPVTQVEMGEEPDGQLIGPEDYGALYARFARAIRRVAAGVTLGGPGFSTAVPDWTAWPDGHGTTSWTARFLAELRAQHAAGELGFFSFEWYPFDDVCAASAPELARQPVLLRAVLARQYAAGLPRREPVVITEYGYSAFAARAEVSLAGGLVDADIAASFLAAGGLAAYVYGYEPDQPIRESTRCSTYGNLALWRSDSAHRALAPLAAHWALRLLGREWLPHPAGPVAAASTGTPSVSAYAAGGAGGRALSLLVINKDPRRSRTITVSAAGAGAGLRGPADLYLFGPAQYAWRARGADGFASPDRPPVHRVLRRGTASIVLPAFSMAVLRARCAQPCG